MSLTLLLVRHSQAQENSPDESDRERNLTNAGIRQAMRLGKFLQNESKIPDILVSSTALRALTTAELIGEQVGISVDDIVKNVTLYQGSVRIFLKAINVMNENWK
jgi:phosphohistidine phosphatase